MSNGILTQALKKMAETEANRHSESFSIINVRPGPKISAMLDIACHLNRQTPSALIADALSRKLAEYSASSTDCAEAVLSAAETSIESQGVISPDSALGLLEKSKLLAVRNPFMQAFVL